MPINETLNQTGISVIQNTDIFLLILGGILLLSFLIRTGILLTRGITRTDKGKTTFTITTFIEIVAYLLAVIAFFILRNGGGV